MKTNALRCDVPNTILEMLLFEGEPQGRSRQELEARYDEAISIPYISRWLGTSATPQTCDFMRQRDEFLAAAKQVLNSFAYAPGKGPEWFEATRNVVAKYSEQPVHNAQKVNIYTGYLDIPGTGRIQVDFECRQGATDAEKEQAFRSALSQVTTTDYLCLGEK